MAIITASIPIFWPLVTSLALNKILIVNEIEIRTERVDNNGFALADQGKSFAGIGEEEIPNGRASRISVYGKSEMGRNKHSPTHSESSDKAVGNDLGHRQSHESQRKLNLSHQSSGRSFSSDSKSGSDGQYHDKYVADWTGPGFDADGRKVNSPSDAVFMTSADRAEIPYDHIRVWEK
jgi:hypothetical protein